VIQFGRGKAKTIFAGGKEFCFASALFVLGRGFRRAGGCGRNARRILAQAKKKGPAMISHCKPAGRP
jgi:hypothetical protein